MKLNLMSRVRLILPLLLMTASLAGCTAVGAILHVVFGPVPVNAKYVPPKKPTLVLVENYRNPSLSEIDADQISTQISDLLKKHNVVPIVGNDNLQELRDQNPAKYHAMTIPRIGKAAWAKTVIYVDLYEIGITQDAAESSAHASATARVRVVDVKTGDTLWPIDAAQGYQLTVEVPYGNQDEASMNLMRTKMLTSLSHSIAKLFYQWKPDTEEESNNG